MYYRQVQTRGCIYIDFNILYALLWPVWNHIPTVFYICFVRTCARACALHYPPSPSPSSPRFHQSISLFLFHSLSLSSPIFIAIPYDLSVYQSNPRSFDTFSFSLFLMSVRVKLAWMCESMFKPRAFRSSCRLRGWEGDTITGQFFLPDASGPLEGTGKF